MKIGLILLAVVLQAQTWATISPGGTVPFANGFNNKLVYDSVNKEMLYLGHPGGVSSIYSSVISGFNVATGNFTQRINNGATAEHCPSEGAPYNTFNPTTGHPQGFFAASATSAIMTMELCQSVQAGFTYFYTLSTQTMGTALSKGPYGPTGDGTYAAPTHTYQNIDYISGYGKFIIGLYSGAATTAQMIEFDGVSTYTDITASVNFTNAPAMPFTAYASMSDGTYLWVLGGCNGASPGNFSPNLCSGGGNQNDLFRYNPVAKTWLKMAPVGGVKPPTTNMSWPHAYYDSLRKRIVVYAATNDVWVYDIATNTWTEYTTTGGFVVPTSGSIGADGNAANYDPVNDKGVIIWPVNGGGSAVGVYELSFPPVGGSTFGGTISGSVVVH